MAGIREHIESQSGYREYQDLAHRTPRKKYPWKMLAGNVAGIAGAHAVGYYAAGAVANALMKTRLAPKLQSMGAPTRQRLIGAIIGAAGSAGAVAGSLASLAGQARVAEELSRLEKEERSQGRQKVASVYQIYATAMEP